MTRRTFLSVTGGTLGALNLAACTRNADQATPLDRLEGPPLRLSCNLYSFNGPLAGGETTLTEVLDFCASLGFDAVDPTGYYFPGYPEVPADTYVASIKRQAFLAGMDISGTGIRNDFTVAEAESRRADIQLASDWIGVAQRLGAPCIRLFAGHEMPGGFGRPEMLAWVAEGLRACAGVGAEHGVMIAVQNHAAFLKTADQILELLDTVDSDWCALNLDIGSFRTGDTYADITRVIDRAVTWQIKENITQGGEVVPTDLSRLFEIIARSDYHGYLPLETLGEGDPFDKVPRFLDRVRAVMVEQGLS